MEAGGWKSQLQPNFRQQVVNEILETLKRHLPHSGDEGLNELRKIAERFEEKMCTTANSQTDYLRKIHLKMVAVDPQFQSRVGNSNNSLDW